MKRLLGTIIIIVSALFALGAYLSYEDDLIFSIIYILLFCPLLFLLGQFLRTSKVEYKEKWRFWLAVYVYVFIIIPGIFLSLDLYSEQKRKAMDDGRYILFEPGSSDFGMLALILAMVLIFILIPTRLFSPDLKRKKLVSVLAIVVFLAYGAFQYFMWKDFRGFHADLGLVSQNWLGEKTVHSFSEMEAIYVNPYVHYASLSDSSDETQFRWELIFLLKDGEEVVYKMGSTSEYSLELGNQVKAAVLEKQRPLIIHPMTQKEKEWFEFEIELEKLDKEPFYQFFEVESK